MNIIFLVNLFCSILSLNFCSVKFSTESLTGFKETNPHLELVQKYGGSMKSIPLRNVRNRMYYGEITIGKPEQKFRVGFSTMSPTFWLTSLDCPPSVFFCTNHRQYNHSASSTYKSDGSKYEYVNGHAFQEGYFSIESINIGGVEISDQSFVEITNMSNYFYSSIKPDGLMGLMPSIDMTSKSISPFMNAVVKKKIDPIFSFYLKDYYNTTSNNYGGEFMFGGFKEKYFKGKIQTVPLEFGDSWTVNSDGIEFGNVKLCQYGCHVNFSIEDTFIVGPKDDIASIHENMKDVHKIHDFYFVKCSTIDQQPTLTIRVKDVEITLSPKEYIFRYGFSTCYTGFIENSAISGTRNSWRLGLNYFRTYYTVFNAGKKTITFGKAL